MIPHTVPEYLVWELYEHLVLDRRNMVGEAEVTQAEVEPSWLGVKKYKFTTASTIYIQLFSTQAYKGERNTMT